MLAPVIDGAAHDFSEDVISAFVAGHSTVGHGESGRAGVFRHDAQRKTGVRYRLVKSFGESRRFIDNRLD